MNHAQHAQLNCAVCSELSPAANPTCVACGQSPLLDGRYRLDAVLGRGAMGVTFRATRVTDGRIVAAKELPLHRVDSLKTTELFEREANVLRSLSHPSIPAWVDHFTIGSGKQMALWIVQEFIDGDTLEGLASTRRHDERTVLLSLRELLDTLVYLGDLRPPVVHRDLKPQNMMRRRADDSFVLIDFGSVRAAVHGSLAGGSTVAGTFGYMAPEQFAGQASTATDIYGAGATALALLAGTGAEQLLGADGRLDWKDRVVMSGPLRVLLERMLAITPAQRPTAAEARAAVDALLVAPPSSPPPRPNPLPVRNAPPAPRLVIAAQPPSTSQRPTPAQPPRGMAAAFWAGAAVVLLSGLVVVVSQSSDSDNAPELAEYQPRRVTKVAPPLGLAFDMSHAEAEKTWPSLATVEPLAPEVPSILELAPPGSAAADLSMMVDAVQAKGPAVIGTAYRAPATFGQLASTCKVRFAALGAATTEGLVSFECDVQRDTQDERDAVLSALVAGWKERFGEPTSGRFSPYTKRSPAEIAVEQSYPLWSGVAAEWESDSATVRITKEYSAVTLSGETHAWRTHREETARAAVDAWQRDKDERARALKATTQQKLEGVGADL